MSASFSIDVEPELICVRFRDALGVEGVEELVERLAAHRRARGRKLRVLCDLRGLRHSTAEGRAAAAGDRFEPYVAVGALVVGNPVSRVIGSFFLRLTRPTVPTRLFGSEEAARAFLLAFQPDS